jgi:thiamine biosynthesis lipoprotein
MKKIIGLTMALTLLLSCVGCTREPSYQKYEKQYYDLFDTFTLVIGYTASEKEFEKYAKLMYDEMFRIHRLCDIYHSYEGMNNLKTVNEHAGISAVQVDPTLIDLLRFAQTAFDVSSGSLNAAMGSVLRLWHDAREWRTEHPESAEVPSPEALAAASLHTDVNNIEIDEKAGTVFLLDLEMSLDLGAIAKGYAVNCAVELAREAGMVSGFINAGGYVCVVGKPLDGRDAWVIGVQNPDASEDKEALFDKLSVTDASVVTSGDYERFFVADGVRYHHIIDPATNFPAARYHSVTIVGGDSGIGDMLSTSLFILPYEDGLKLAERFGAEVLWIFCDGTVRMTEGYKTISEKYGKS